MEAAEQKLTPILSPSEDLTIAARPQPSTPSKKLAPGVIAGIVVATVILCILAFGAIFFIRRRRRRSEDGPRSSRLNDQVELDGINKPAEADSGAAWKPGLEMEGDNAPVSLEAKGRHVAEFPGSNAGAEMEGSRGGVEMEGGVHPAAVELDAGPIFIHEISSPNTTTREDSIPSDRGTPLPRPDSRGPRLPQPNLRNSRLQSAGLGDVSPPSSAPTHPNLIPSSRDIPPQPTKVPSERINSGGVAEQAEVETRGERSRRERRNIRRRREERTE